jgi:hypothetical protein
MSMGKNFFSPNIPAVYSSFMTRNPVPKDIQDQVVLLSRRRCCICFGLNADLELKQGQIAHLDHNNTNFDMDNVAFLCLPHHDQYDSTTSQSKGLREGEVKRFRQELYDRIAAGLPGDMPSRGTGSRRTQAVNQGPTKTGETTRKEEASPNVGSLRPEIIHITYDEESDVWLKRNLAQDKMDDFLAVVLPFSNDPQPRNRNTLPVYLRARITYYRRDDLHEFKRIDSGCWLGEVYRSIELEVGGIVYLIAAVLINGQGAFIENTRHKVDGYNEGKTFLDSLPNSTYELKVTLMGGDNGEYSEEYWFELEIGEQLKCKRINPFPSH